MKIMFDKPFRVLTDMKKLCKSKSKDHIDCHACKYDDLCDSVEGSPDKMKVPMMKDFIVKLFQFKE